MASAGSHCVRQQGGPEAFIGSRWIWTINLVFDNTVLLRKTVR
jgi:hypothetical protein